MYIILQIIFGSLVGLLAFKPWSNKFLDITLGILGAMSACSAMSLLGLTGVSFNVYSFIIAMAGGMAMIHLSRWIQSFPDNTFNSFPQN